jgi:hypothetical protein
MRLIVQRIHHNPGETITIGVGTDDEGHEVRFAGDWRPMREIADAIERGEEPEAEIPDWAVLGPLDG